jgi:hypothetical protein
MPSYCSLSSHPQFWAVHWVTGCKASQLVLSIGWVGGFTPRGNLLDWIVATAIPSQDKIHAMAFGDYLE